MTLSCCCSTAWILCQTEACLLSTHLKACPLDPCLPVMHRDVVDDVFAHALKKQTGVALKYMLDFGANPIERQLVLSAQVRATSARPPWW